MINLTQRISLSKKSKKKINKYVKMHGLLDSDSWKNINKSVRHEISCKLLSIQKLQCAYCEGSLITQGNQIDHFSPKSLTPKFTYTCSNLFYACLHCNSTERKGSKPTIIDPINDYYSMNFFRIVHPLFDDTDNEIIFTDDNRATFDWERCSLKGIYTIWFFNFTDPRMTMIRNSNALLRRYSSAISFSDRVLIDSIIAYK